MLSLFLNSNSLILFWDRYRCSTKAARVQKENAVTELVPFVGTTSVCLSIYLSIYIDMHVYYILKLFKTEHMKDIKHDLLAYDLMILESITIDTIYAQL